MSLPCLAFVATRISDPGLEIRKQGPQKEALSRYYMHNIGHSIGLDVHDVAPHTEPMQAGWIVTCEPGIYIREEKIGVRIENMIQITETGPVDLMPEIAIEADEIETLMAQSPRPTRRR